MLWIHVLVGPGRHDHATVPRVPGNAFDPHLDIPILFRSRRDSAGLVRAPRSRPLSRDDSTTERGASDPDAHPFRPHVLGDWPDESRVQLRWLRTEHLPVR